MHHALNDPTIAYCKLRSLCEGFFDDLSWVDDCGVVTTAEMTPAARSLLVHNDHMTATLSAHYHQPVALQVFGFREDTDVYRRKIALTVGEALRVIEVGVVRVDLAQIGNEIRREVVARKVPLGDILNKHGVLTRVEPKWFVRFPKESPIACAFRPRPDGDVFGRIGRIYCDDKPVIELLEVVRP